MSAPHHERIVLRPPADAHRTLQRFGRYGHDPANRIEPGGALVRCLRDGAGRAIACRITPLGGEAVAVDSSAPLDATAHASLLVTLGDGWDPALVDRAAAADPQLAAAIAGVQGYRPACFADPFEAIVTLICAQHITLLFAVRIRARLVERYGEPVAFAHAFPTAEVLAAADPAELRAMQLTGVRAESIVGLARAVAGGELDLGALAQLEDEAVIERVCALRGIGRWTAEWLLLRTLGRPDSLPATDAGVRAVIGRLEGLTRGPEGAIRARAERWAPARGLVALTLLEAAYS